MPHADLPPVDGRPEVDGEPADGTVEVDAAPSDLAFGVFSDHPPWVLDDRDGMPWQRGIDELRARTRASVPELTRVRRVPPGGRLAVTARHLGPALAGWWLGTRRRRRSGTDSVADLARRLRLAAEALGPTYIKLGQIISAGRGVFPDVLVSEFERCRDQVPAEPFPLVRATVEAELGRPLHEVFERFDRRALAAASIAQVHTARLRTGEEVVVKVQRSTVADRVGADLAVLAWVAPHLIGRIPVAALANPPALVELFAETISEELDFRLEAQNMLDVSRVLAELGQRRYVVPRPHPELVTRRVLVMERLHGFAFDDLAAMAEAGIDPADLVRAGMIGFLEGAMLHGVFHGDLHGGNLLVQPDGRVALLDFGITARFDEHRRQAFLRLMLGGMTNDVLAQLAALRDLGALPADTDLQQVSDDLGLEGPTLDPTTLSADQLVAEVRRVLKALLGYGARMPKELMLYVKNLLFLDGAIATLAPDLDLLGVIAEVATHFATAHGDRLAAELGPGRSASLEVDLEGVKASLGLDPALDGFTYRDLQERRALIRSRLAGRERAG